MLRANKDMWGSGTFQAVIDRRKKVDRDAAIAHSTASAAPKRNREDDDPAIGRSPHDSDV